MKLIREIDYLLLAATIATVGLGIIAIYSAAYHSDSQVVQMAWIKQARFAFIALLGSLVVMHMPNKLLYGLSYPFYGFALLSLIAVLLWGTGEDAARWLHVGPLRLQPSEFAKIASIIATARYLSDCSAEHVNQARHFVGAFNALPDSHGSCSTPARLGNGHFFYSPPAAHALLGRHAPHIRVFCPLSPAERCLFLRTLMAGSSSLSVRYFYHRQQHGRAFTTGTSSIHGNNLPNKPSLWISHRLLMGSLSPPLSEGSHHDFPHPESDRLGTGWNIIQSKIAIGSGGLTGKGFLEGTQTKYEFLPAAHTDFIFSVVGEELGFIGALITLSLFFFLIARALYIGSVTNNRFYSLIAVGLGSMLAFHVFVNVGMTIGVMPVTGLPLPFLSSGGSSLLANLLAIGLLMHIFAYRHEY